MLLDIIIGILLIVAVSWISFQIGYWYRGIRILQEMAKIVERNQSQTNDLINKINSDDRTLVEDGLIGASRLLNITMLKHEVIDGRHFLYTKDTDTFVAQGNTLEEVAVQYSQVNKTVGCVANLDDETDNFFIVDGAITTELIK